MTRARIFILIALLSLSVGLAASCGGSSSEGAATSASGGSGGTGTASDGGEGGKLFGTGGMTIRGVSSLAFNPPSATVTIDGVTQASASFELVATYNTGEVITVTAASLQFDRPDLAVLDSGPPAALTTVGDYAGTGQLFAIFDGVEAIATLTVNIERKDNPSMIDPTIIGALDDPNNGPDPALTALSYPYDATVFPLGLASPLVMWTAPQADDVYRLRLEQNGYVFDTYQVLPLPAQLRADQQVWDFFSLSNAGDPVVVTLSRYDAQSQTAYVSATQSWSIAPESLRGAIYYWTTSAGGHLARINPGTGSAPVTINNGYCMGCHAVSADGSTLVASWEGQPTNDGSNDDRAWSSWDLPGETMRTLSTSFSGNLAVTPDGAYTVYGSQTMRLGDTTTGLEISGTGLDTLPLEPNMVGFMTPAFSPDGSKLTMVEGMGTWYHNLHSGQLVVVDFDQATTTFSNKQALAHTSSFTAGQNVLQYPSFSPDSEWITFHAVNDPDGRDNGDMWLQHVSGVPLIRLDELTDAAPNPADDNHSLEPTFNPEERGGYFWVVFTSSREWGNRITGVQTDIEQERLWVAAIDAQIGTTDPSHPPFFLEGQEETTKNRRGFWTLADCIPTGDPTPCGAGFECCSGFCIDGVCGEPEDKPCVGTGEACTNDGDCCNEAFVHCQNGMCTPQVPN